MAGILSVLGNHQGIISLFCLRNQPKEEASLEAKDEDSARPPPDGSRLFRFDELAESLIRETERLCF